MKTPASILSTLPIAIALLSSSAQADLPAGFSHVVAVQASQSNGAQAPPTEQIPKGYAFVTYESIKVASDESEVVSPFGPDLEIPEGVERPNEALQACIVGCGVSSSNQAEYDRCVAECKLHHPIGRDASKE